MSVVIAGRRFSIDTGEGVKLARRRAEVNLATRIPHLFLSPTAGKPAIGNGGGCIMRKMLNAALGACLAVGVTGGGANADPPDAAPHQRFDLGDFRLESGQMIEKGFLTYVTYG